MKSIRSTADKARLMSDVEVRHYDGVGFTADSAWLLSVVVLCYEGRHDDVKSVVATAGSAWLLSVVVLC